jgi:DNA-3-methyladenine glycosylase I
MDEKTRCFGSLPIYDDYHDKEWGRSEFDDRRLFEMLMLEGMQAGLSWLIVLKKREAYRSAFDNFDPHKIALYNEAKVEKLMQNEGIIRNRRKIEAIITNAKAYLALTAEQGSFSDWLWHYVDNRPIIGHWKKVEDIPVTTEVSDRLSADLKKRGFKFVGSTIVYSFMQAVGMVNDHFQGCFVYKELINK